MYTITTSTPIESTEYQELDYKIKVLEIKMQTSNLIHNINMVMMLTINAILIAYIVLL